MFISYLEDTYIDGREEQSGIKGSGAAREGGKSGAEIDQTMPSNRQYVPPIIGLELGLREGVAELRSGEALCRREEPSEEMHVPG
jgi:hypothetical protein